MNHNRTALAMLAIVQLFVGCSPFLQKKSPEIVDKHDWPLAMSDLLMRYPGISNSITTYKHDAFIDSKFAWKIDGQADEIDRLIIDLNLQETNTDHVKFAELQRSIPNSWNLPLGKETKIYVSSGFGKEHQEGTDLLILVRDPSITETFVLYEWIF